MKTWIGIDVSKATLAVCLLPQQQLLASVPLPAAPGKDGFIELTAELPADTQGKHDLCLVFTGDTRPTMWVLDTVTLQPR